MSLGNRQKGFTLVEVLVALVITSLLVSILMGSLYYLFRVEDSLRDEIVVREANLRSRAWLDEVLGGCLPAEGGSGSELIGMPKEIVCDTVSPLRPQKTTAPRRVTVGLQRGKNGETEITYKEQGGKPGAQQVIATLPEGEFRFVYSGTRKGEVDNWPVARKDPETLPRRIFIRVRTMTGENLELLVAVRADPWLEPVPRNPFGVDVNQL